MTTDAAELMVKTINAATKLSAFEVDLTAFSSTHALSKIVLDQYNIRDYDFEYITISDLLYWICFYRIETEKAWETTGLFGKTTGKRLNSLSDINADKYSEVAKGVKRKLAMRWIG
jgi:hypothetical protein